MSSFPSSGTDPEASDSLPLLPPLPFPTPTALWPAASVRDGFGAAENAPRPPPLRPSAAVGHRHHGTGGAHRDPIPSVDPRPLFPPRHVAAAGRPVDEPLVRSEGVRDEDRRAMAAGLDGGPLPRFIYHSSPRRPHTPPSQSPFLPRHHSLPIRRDRSRSRSPPPAREHSAPLPLHSLPPLPHSLPQPPVIPPDLLVLDMRCDAKLEDALGRFISYLENVRQFAMERGLVDCDERDGRNPGSFRKLFVTIVTGSNPAGSVLRTILQNLLRKHHIHFVDRGGNFFHVDALSGTVHDDSAGGGVGMVASTLGGAAVQAIRMFDPVGQESTGAWGIQREEEEAAPQACHPPDSPLPDIGGQDRERPHYEENLQAEPGQQQQCFSSLLKRHYNRSSLESPNDNPGPSPTRRQAQLLQERPLNEGNLEHGGHSMGKPPLSPHRQELMRMQGEIHQELTRMQTRTQAELSQRGSGFFSDGLEHEMPNPMTAANASEEGVTAGEPPHHPNTNSEPPSSSQQHQKFAWNCAQLLQGHYSSHPPEQQHTHRYQDRQNPYPQNQSAEIQLNPFVSIAQTLLTRSSSPTSSLGKGNAGPYHSHLSPRRHRQLSRPGSMVCDAYRNAAAGTAILEATTLLDTMTNLRTDRFSAATHLGGGHPDYPADSHHPLFPVFSPAEATLVAPTLTPMRSLEHRDSSVSDLTSTPRRSSENSDSISDVTNPSNLNHPSTNSPTIHPSQQQRPSTRRADDLGRAIRQAIAESHTTHTAHTRKEVTQEIRFGRALERATNERARSDCQARTDNSDAQGTVPKAQQNLTQDEADFVQTIRQSVLDERNRKIEAEKKYALELEVVLKQSEDLVMHQQTEEQRLNRSLEELVQGVVTKSRSEAETEADMQNEEELLREAVAQSLAKKAEEEKEREREDELLMSVLTQSLAEDAARKEKTKQDEKEQLQWALSQSVGQEGKASEDELLEEGIQNSLSEGDNEKTEQIEEEQVRWALTRCLDREKDPELESEKMPKMSLGEKEHIGKEKGGQLKKAMQSSKSQSESSDVSDTYGIFRVAEGNLKKAMQSSKSQSESSDVSDTYGICRVAENHTQSEFSGYYNNDGGFNVSQPD